MNRVNRLAFLLFLLRAQPFHALVSKSFGTSNLPTNLQLNSLPTTAESIYNEEYENSIIDDPHTLSHLTGLILEQPCSLDQDILKNVYPVLLSWGKKENAEGATTVERILEKLEKDIGEREDHLKLTHYHYTIAVDAWGKSGREDSAKNAERIFKKMEAKAESNPSMSPSRVTYNALMNAHSKRGDAKRIAELLTIMENSPRIEPTTKDYNVLLSAFAKLGEARQSEDMMKRMVDRCREQDDECECLPDLYSYNMLLDAWAKSHDSGRGERAEDILKTLEHKYEIGEFQWKPDVRSYASAICAVARSDETNGVTRAENILAHAKKLGIVPDVFLYSALLDAYASSTSAEKAAKAEEILDKLEEEGIANTVAYNMVIKAWKSTEDGEAPHRAEAIVRRMQRRGLADDFSYCTLVALYANKGDRESAERAEEILRDMHEAGKTPNTHTLNSVMNAWVRCGQIGRAEKIMEQMEKAFYDGKGEVVPNVVSYTTLMNGWARSKHTDTVEKTEEVFGRMRAMFESGNIEARPNLFSYVTLINCITKSGGEKAAEKSESIIFEMYKQNKNGHPDVKPNTQLVSSVIDSWQKSGARDAGERAELLLNWLIDVYQQEGDKSLRPNEFSFTSAISAWAKTRKFGKAVRARAILSKMIKMHESGAIPATPNTHCYTAVINGCAYCENDELERRDALQIAIKTYKELTDSKYGKPNHVTFSTVITALRNLTPASEKRAAAVSTVFKQCADAGEVSEFVLRRLQSALNLDQLREVVGNDAVSADGSIDINQIPSQWRRNTNSGPKRQRNPRQFATQIP